ncbi:hypothetical protein NWE55_09920 [Myroides albus]|uniref:Uncharacterized protein n=1 Tax=Myroides albus TaxID=2562892 RepID=A0A6I3LE94_9FLAO|nr:hypothetical protein [Myroides albus]MTG96798.1 hypothetical protein [Myroides albus]UVD78452.1 hypothetical protein NWE55_09920 [Myroides albus]
MKENTSQAYIEAVQFYIQTKIKEGKEDYYLSPSPKRIKELSKRVYKGSNVRLDQKIISTFFGLEESRSIDRQFDSFDLSKLKPVQNFILGKTKRPGIVIVDLVAVLYEFPIRPLQQFLNQEREEIESFVLCIQERDMEVLKNLESMSQLQKLRDNREGNDQANVSTYIKLHWLVVCSLVIIFFY